jgi:WD40 repeat protein
VSPDGSDVFVTGGSWGTASDTDYATVAYDASTGARLWARRYNGTRNDFDLARSLSVSPDGTTVFVTGGSDESDGLFYTTIAYDATTGARDWIAHYKGLINQAQALAVSPDGNTVFVTGASYGYLSSTGYDYATIAYDAATGTRLWVRRFDGPASDDDEASSIAVSPGGGSVFVAGESTGIGTGLDFAVIAYSTG